MGLINKLKERRRKKEKAELDKILKAREEILDKYVKNATEEELEYARYLRSLSEPRILGQKWGIKRKPQ